MIRPFYSPGSGLSMNFLNHFPSHITPRELQRKALQALSENWDDFDIFVIDAPVGSGKSALAMTISSAVSSAHVITPRKGLQLQYKQEYKQDVSLMMGRTNYPCFWNNPKPENEERAFSLIMEDKPATHLSPRHCGGDYVPCKSSRVKQKCAELRECPFVSAVIKSQQHPVVVHNTSSFFFHTSMGDKFDLRDVVIVDEAHNLEGSLRDIETRKYKVMEKYFPTTELTVPQAQDYLLGYGQDTLNGEELESYKASILSINPTNTVVRLKPETNEVEFVPLNVHWAFAGYVQAWGRKVVLMSGTVLDINKFCSSLGINRTRVHYQRIPTDFPVANRPIRLPKNATVNMSYQSFQDPETKEKAAKIIRYILGKMPLAKGVIHAPSYDLMSFVQGLDDRIVVARKGFVEQDIAAFKASKEPLVLCSPAVTEGYDFPEDAARFQIIMRIPYPGLSDPFIVLKKEQDYSWYLLQTCITFCQQLGRVVRSRTDFGITFLLDSRFAGFIASNRAYLPADLVSSAVDQRPFSDFS